MKSNPDDRHIMAVSVKLSPALVRLILEIGGTDDRGKSYVVRELMRRGLTLYEKDGQIKATPDEERVITEMIEHYINSGNAKNHFDEKSLEDSL